MTKDQLERKVSELERRVKELESQPREQHFHYHPPVYAQPYTPPAPHTEPYRIVIGDPPPWDTTTNPWIPNSTGTVTWSGGRH